MTIYCDKKEGEALIVVHVILNILIILELLSISKCYCLSTGNTIKFHCQNSKSIWIIPAMFID